MRPRAVAAGKRRPTGSAAGLVGPAPAAHFANNTSTPCTVHLHARLDSYSAAASLQRPRGPPRAPHGARSKQQRPHKHARALGPAGGGLAALAGPAQLLPACGVETTFCAELDIQSDRECVYWSPETQRRHGSCSLTLQLKAGGGARLAGGILALKIQSGKGKRASAEGPQAKPGAASRA